MYNRYQGNTGRVVRVKEGHEAPKPRPAPKPAPTVPPPSAPAPPVRFPPFMGGLQKLFMNSLSELETEDLILLLILYLMYRESGDSELLIIMGAMFLL